MRGFGTALLCVAMALAFIGCGAKPSRSGMYDTPPINPLADPGKARLHNDLAVSHMQQCNLDAAEQELRIALTADPSFGPAHNNLGAVYFQQKRFYQAAAEFELAARTMPDSAEPHNNLGLLFETLRRLGPAVEAYEQARNRDPQSVEVAGNLARVYVQMGRDDDRVRELLTIVAYRDSRPDWIAWSRDLLAKMGGPTTRPVVEEQGVLH